MSAAAHDVAGILAQWGESITYIPQGGEARTITAIVDKSVRPIQDQFGIWQDRLAEVFVKRDATAGIDAIPEYGSSVKTSSLAEGEAYSFEGTVVNEDDESLKLEFVIHDPKRRGGNYAKR